MVAKRSPATPATQAGRSGYTARRVTKGDDTRDAGPSPIAQQTETALRLDAAASPPFRLFNSQLIGVTQLTPTLRRFTLRGASLNQLAEQGFDQRVRLVLPAADGDATALTAAGAAGQSANQSDSGFAKHEIPATAVAALTATVDWYQQWLQLPARVRPVLRSFTARAVRHCDRAPELSEVDIDVALHAASGPVQNWAAAAQPGDTVWLHGANRRCSAIENSACFVPPPVTMWYLLAGDETAAPAIARIMEQLPKTANGIVLLELPTVADGAYLPQHPGFKVFVTTRSGVHGDELFQLFSRNFKVRAGITERQDPCDIDIEREQLWEVPRGDSGGAALASTGVYAWVAGEAAMVKRIRHYLIRDMGIDRRSAAFMGYWRQGRAEH